MPNSKLSQQLSQVNRKEEPLGWNDVISDAEEELRALANRRIALKASIKLFKRKMEAGEPLPEGLLAVAKN